MITIHYGERSIKINYHIKEDNILLNYSGSKKIYYENEKITEHVVFKNHLTLKLLKLLSSSNLKRIQVKQVLDKWIHMTDAMIESHLITELWTAQEYRNYLIKGVEIINTHDPHIAIIKLLEIMWI